MSVAARFENLALTRTFPPRLVSPASDLAFFVSDLSQANVLLAR